MGKSKHHKPDARGPHLGAFADAALDEEVEAARVSYPYWPGILLLVPPFIWIFFAFYTFDDVLAFEPVIPLWKWGFVGILGLLVLAIIFKTPLYRVLYLQHALLKRQGKSFGPWIPLPAFLSRAVFVWILWPLILTTALLFMLFVLLYPFHLLVAEDKGLTGIVTYTVANDCWVGDAWSLGDGLSGLWSRAHSWWVVSPSDAATDAVCVGEEKFERGGAGTQVNVYAGVSALGTDVRNVYVKGEAVAFSGTAEDDDELPDQVMARLTDSGVIREADDNDITAIQFRQQEVGTDADLPTDFTDEAGIVAADDAYTVERAFDVPGVVAWSGGYCFIVPKNVAMDADAFGENTVYTLTDGRCTGPGCNTDGEPCPIKWPD